MLNFLKGKKTYITAIATIIYAVSGWVLGFVEQTIAIPMILGSLQVLFLRNGMPSSDKTE